MSAKEVLVPLLFATLFIGGFYGFYRLIFFLLIRSGRKAMEEINTTLTRATPALAQVTRADTLTTPGRKPRLGAVYCTLTLEVHPSEGAPFPAITTWEVSRSALPQIQPGQVISVRIDADKPTTIYPDLAGVWYKWP
ncbi:MAG TPA: hypothetical protein PK530_13590 [Anaerolineales bacterium]|nr:hypothetical protein [Anaerolineales bacterium]